MAQKFWMGGSGNWSVVGNWRTTSGGTIVPAAIPGTGDEAIFDNNSISGNTAVTVTLSAAVTVGSINASGLTTGSGSVTFAGSSTVAITNGAGTGAGLTLPSSRFTWNATGVITFTGTGTVNTSGIAMACGTTISAAATSITLNSNLNTAGPFQLLGGSINIGAYQWFCSTFTSTGTTATSITSSAGGGITITGSSGTVVNCTKTATQLTFPGTKPTLTLNNASASGGRTIIWSAVSFATSTSTMPGLKIINGSDTVTFTGYSSPTNTNWALFDCTGFTGNYTTTYNVGGYCYVYGNFIFPSTAGTLSNMSYVFLSGTGNLEAKCPTTSFNMAGSSVYTQTGPITVINLIDGGSGATLTINGTGAVTVSGIIAGFNVTNLTLVGAVTFLGSGLVWIQNPVVTSLTSLSISASTCFLINASLTVPITFSGSFNQLTFSSFSSTQTVTATCASFTMGGTTNIPSNSVINLNFAAGVGTDLQPTGTCTNAFTINLNIPATAIAYVSGANSVGGDPNLVVTGSGILSFSDSGANFFQAYLSSLNTTGYSGTSSISYRLYVKNSLSQSSSTNVIDEVYLNTGATGTFTLNTPALAIFNGSASSQNINVTSATLSLNSSFTSSQGILSLNSCVINNVGGIIVASPGTLNPGTSTINCSSGNINTPGQPLNNVVLTSTLYAPIITAASINTISNSVQPATVNFQSDIVFTNFNLNGTAGNLVTVTGYPTTVRTLTKPNAWTLANSTDGGNNTGLTFGSTGNNSYLNVSYINGVTSGVLSTGNFFLLF